MRKTLSFLKNRKFRLKIVLMLFLLGLGLVENFIPLQVNATTFFSDGFESGTILTTDSPAGKWEEKSGTPTVTSTRKHSGTYSCEFTADGQFVQSPTFSDLTTIFAKSWMNIGTLPTNSTWCRFLYIRGITTTIAHVSLEDSYGTKDLLLDYYYGAGPGFVRYNFAFQLNTQYCVELKFLKASGTSGEYRVYLNGNEVITVTGLDTSAAPSANNIRVGAIYSTYTPDIYIDDVEVANTYIGTGSPPSVTISAGAYVGTNSTVNGTKCKFFANWVSVGSNLSTFIFGTDNTESWVNDTAVEFPSGQLTGWSNVTKTLNSQAGIEIQWQVWASNEAGNWTSTGLQSFVTPTYNPVTNWYGVEEPYELILTYHDHNPDNMHNPNYLSDWATLLNDQRFSQWGFNTITLHLWMPSMGNNTSFSDDTRLVYDRFASVVRLLATYGLKVVASDHSYANFGSELWMDEWMDFVTWLNEPAQLDVRNQIVAYELRSEASEFAYEQGPWWNGLYMPNRSSPPSGWVWSDMVTGAYANLTDRIHAIEPTRMVAWADPAAYYTYAGVGKYIKPSDRRDYVAYAWHIWSLDSEDKGHTEPIAMQQWEDDGYLSPTYPHSINWVGEFGSWYNRGQGVATLSGQKYTYTQTGDGRYATSPIGRPSVMQWGISNDVGFMFYGWAMTWDKEDEYCTWLDEVNFVGPNSYPQEDTLIPTYSNVYHNTTIAEQAALFGCKWQDNDELSGYIFSYNGTGSWVNETWVLFAPYPLPPTNPDWATDIKTLPVASTVVGYRWYANDTSNNWAVTQIFSFVTTPIGQSIAVLLNVPTNGSTVYSTQENFTYTPVFSEDIQNSSLWLGIGGTWEMATWNSSTVQNNTINTLTYSFMSSGTYIWNVGVFNTSVTIFSQQNRTLIVALEPQYDTMNYNSTIMNTSCDFKIHAVDVDGLSGAIFSWNGTGSWTNSSWVSLGSQTDAWSIGTKTLPNTVKTVVGYMFYINDTGDKWTATSILSLTTSVFGSQSLLDSNNLLIQNDLPYLEDSTHKITALSYSNNILTFTVSAPSSVTSTAKVYCGDKGQPTSVSGYTTHSYDQATKISTVTKLHESEAVFIFSWSQSGFNPPPTTTPTTIAYVLTVKVTDANGVYQSNAKVTVWTLFGSIIQSKTTTSSGTINFNVNPGTYMVSAEKEGLALEKVTLNQNTTITLTIGAPSSIRPFSTLTQPLIEPTAELIGIQAYIFLVTTGGFILLGAAALTTIIALLLDKKWLLIITIALTVLGALTLISVYITPIF